MKMPSSVVLLIVGLQLPGCATIEKFRLGYECESNRDEQALNLTKFVDNVTSGMRPLGLMEIEKTPYEAAHNAVAVFGDRSAKLGHEELWITIWPPPNLRVTIWGNGSYETDRVRNVRQVLQSKLGEICPGQIEFGGGYDWFSGTGRLIK